MEKKTDGKYRSKITNNEIISLYNLGLSQEKVANKLGINRKTVVLRMKDAGVSVREQKMHTHPSWKGGAIMRNGYPFKRVPNHHRATKNGYVALHLLKMEEKLGREINGKHPIHHIDFDKLNCNIDNLYLCKDEKEHRKIPCSLDYIARELYHKGIIGFKNGKYYII